MPKKTGVPAPVVQAVQAWAQAADPPAVLAERRRSLDPLLLPVLVEEVAEVTAEQFLVMIDLPAPPGDDGPEVDFLGMPLAQSQARRVAVWLDEQAPTAKALGLSSEAWSKKLADGFVVAISALQGKSSATAQAAAARLGVDPLAQASKGFQGGVDPARSEQAGLRGLLALRSFTKK
jgi:hypothetical protein